MRVVYIVLAKLNKIITSYITPDRSYPNNLKPDSSQFMKTTEFCYLNIGNPGSGCDVL